MKKNVFQLQYSHTPVKAETVEEFLSRGGQITMCPTPKYRSSRRSKFRYKKLKRKNKSNLGKAKGRKKRRQKRKKAL